AIRMLATVVPEGMARVSGSAPRLPTRITLLTPRAMSVRLHLLEWAAIVATACSRDRPTYLSRQNSFARYRVFAPRFALGGIPISCAPIMPIARAALLRYLIALISGALVACAFAPMDLWPLAILGPAALMYLWRNAAPRHAAWLGFWFNAGTFGLGTYWLYISIHDFGPAPIWLALSIVIALVAIMGSYHALLGYVVARWLPKTGQLRWLVAIPAAWLLIEWWRGWFLSGFAWLSLGYSQTDTWLAGLAPVLGVYGLSAILLVNAGALVSLAMTRKWLPALTAI